MNRRLSLLLALTTCTLLGSPVLVSAQESPEEQPAEAQPTEPAGEQPATPGEELPAASGEETEPEEADKQPDTSRPDGDDTQSTTSAQPDPQPQPVEQPPVEEPPPTEEPASSGFEPVEVPSTDTSPIADLAGMSDEDFIPLEDIEEEDIDPIFPAQVYPYIDWDGQFRLRQRIATRFDLGTGGTSAILPPTESYTPVGNPANSEANKLWSSDIRMRLEPTISITEGVRLHIETDLLGNQVLGALPVNGLPPNTIRPDPSRNQIDSNQFSPREREWYQNAFTINEAYGELNGFFGTIRAGRMDNHWGTGMFYNDGDCLDCDWGDSLDRIMLQSQFMEIYGSIYFDFPGEGISSVNPNTPLGQPYDRTQIDDIDQYTVSLMYGPQTDLEVERQLNRLDTQRKPVINAGGLFTWRTQEGTFANTFVDPDLSTTNNALIYRGMNMYIGDAWAKFLYHPKADTKIRIELEAMGVFGTMDNARFEAVGQSDDETMAADINCFDETARGNNTDECTRNDKRFQQFGVALESEFSIGGPVDFGLNAGFASGGTTPNWGLMPDSQLNGDDLDFFRFDPDYHIDLILFRNVIGTVTNAYYANPYMQATFFNRGDRKLRFDLDAIVSRAANMEGTPAGNNPWLGVELDGALRFFLKDAFHASAEGGLLLPFDGLNAEMGRQRLTTFGNNAPSFTQRADASTAWTLQFKANWTF